jgi:hypothetical protein
LIMTSCGFDAVFSDVVMPGMSGIEIGQEIRRVYLDLPIIGNSYPSVMVPGEANLAPTRSTEREAASIPCGQSGRCGVTLLRGRIGVESLLDHGSRKQ